MASAPTPARFEALDALRGICAIAVAIYHLGFKTGGVDWSPVRNCWLFVDFFFVLSGFVIAWSYGDRLACGYSPRDFMLLRLGRVYPLYFAVLAAMVLVEVARATLIGGAGHRDAFSGVFSVGGLFASVFALQGFGIWSTMVWNVPGWSLATELWAYLTFAVVCTFARQRYTLVMAILAAAMAGWLIVYGGSMDHANGMVTPRCLYGFGLGVLLARCRPGLGGTALEFVALALVAAFLAFATGVWTVAATPAFAFAVLVFANERGLVSRILRHRLPMALGTLSYALYITHYLVLYVFQNVACKVVGVTGGEATCLDASGWRVVPIVGSFLLIALAVAAAAHVVIEDPGRRWSRRWVNASSRRTEQNAAHAAF